LPPGSSTGNAWISIVNMFQQHDLAEALLMAVRRMRCISTRVTADEYATCERLASRRSLSRWLHDLVLVTLRSDPRELALMSELMALRAILLNLHYALGAGQKLSPELMQKVIARADENKLRLATECLAACQGGAR
jgi:hypothetical protein